MAITTYTVMQFQFKEIEASQDKTTFTFQFIDMLEKNRREPKSLKTIKVIRKLNAKTGEEESIEVVYMNNIQVLDKEIEGNREELIMLVREYLATHP
jgi:hypothetical protein